LVFEEGGKSSRGSARLHSTSESQESSPTGHSTTENQYQASSKAEITGGASKFAKSKPPPHQNTGVNKGHKAYKNSCQIDTNTVHNATVCVDFIKKDTFVGISFIENVPKSCSLFAFSPPDKVVGNIHHIYSISFKKKCPERYKVC